MAISDMSFEKEYLMHVIPRLNDAQVRELISLLNGGKPQAAKKAAAAGSDPYAELMDMIGCDNAKEQISALIAAHRMKQIAEKRNHKTARQHFHLAFIGNPGCNKTSVARICARIFAREGITRTDSFAELTRSSIIGKYQGHTAARVRELFDQYQGGVIFIDEAYALNEKGGDQGTYGEEAINEIIVALENRPETVVIFAGYPDKMESFLDSNPGLRSRVPYTIRFDDYTTDELIRISKKIAGDSGFSISDRAARSLGPLFDAERENNGFGNGRFCRNLIEQAICLKGMNLGVMSSEDTNRFCDASRYSDEMLFTLDEDCFRTGRLQAAPAPKRRIGFG